MTIVAIFNIGKILQKNIKNCVMLAAETVILRENALLSFYKFTFFQKDKYLTNKYILLL